MSDALSLDFAK